MRGDIVGDFSHDSVLVRAREFEDEHGYSEFPWKWLRMYRTVGIVENYEL